MYSSIIEKGGGNDEEIAKIFTTYRKTDFEGEASILAFIQFGLSCP